MPENTQIQDQEDVLAANEGLRTENTRLTEELNAANDLLEAAQQELSALTQRRDELTQQLANAEGNAKTRGDELTRLQAENEQLKSEMAQFNKAVAAEVCKLGLKPKATDHKEVPSNTDLTPTQRVLAAKGVNSVAELSQKPQA